VVVTEVSVHGGATVATEEEAGIEAAAEETGVESSGEETDRDLEFWDEREMTRVSYYL
jgi:hypothetical protein